jgi:preprotein translocase subunit SecG
MILIFVILIVIASIVLGLIVLIQNPKGGGLAGNIAGFSNQFMGVKQTTDVLEKGTWLFAGIIGLLCLFSAMFIPTTTGGNTTTPEIGKPAQSGTPAQNQQQQQPLLPNITPVDTTK